MLPDHIGPFKIERALGRGGMGEVFLARDTRLDRQVAIKALPAQLAQDPDRLSRFQREAKVLASLNHPGIGAIYGLEEANGQHYLILEFVEGETLADRLSKGPITIDESLNLAKQMAEALDVAHEKGVIHRDLKPGNIMVTSDGVVKVLDFGLARTEDSALSSMGATHSPTMLGSPTIPGAIMGTAGYMSPEQARGKIVDKRSDIFSFGCVLYEMLTGTMPFRGETVADSIGATLHKESDLNLLPPSTPRRVRELLTSCLAKDRKNRLHDIGDARLELERAINGHEWALPVESKTTIRSSRLPIVSIACALTLISGGIGWLTAKQLTRPVTAAPAQTFHVSTILPSKPPYSMLVGIAPDAKFLVYQAWPELELETMKPQGLLMVRRLDSDEVTIIEGTEGVASASLSPDGRWIAFACAKDRSRTRFSIKKIAIENGRPSGKPQTICDVSRGSFFNLGWASDREIVFSVSNNTAIYSVLASGGEPRVLLPADANEQISGWDSFRPLVPGQSILASHFQLQGEKVKVNTEVIDLASGKRTVVLRDAGMAQLTSFRSIDGKHEQLLIANRSDMMGLIAVRFDPTTLSTIGDAVSVWNGNLISRFDFSANGTLAMATQSTTSTDRHLAWIDQNGQPQQIPGTARAYGGITISPDGKRVLTYVESTTQDNLINERWVQDLTRNTASQISIGGMADRMIWSNDGLRITFNVFAMDTFSITERPAIASGEALKMFATPVAQQLYLAPSAWSPDGKILAIAQTDIKTNISDILMLEQESGNLTWKATPYLNSPADEHNLRFSPDGKWIIFCSVDSGRHELYAQRFTGSGSGAKDAASGRFQVSTTGHDGGAWWSPDGKELRYVDGEKQVVSVDVTLEPTFSTSLPKVLYSLKDLKTKAFTWAPDGRLMAILLNENEQANKIDVVVNFNEEIRAKMNTPK